MSVTYVKKTGGLAWVALLLGVSLSFAMTTSVGAQSAYAADSGPSQGLVSGAAGTLTAMSDDWMVALYGYDFETNTPLDAVIASSSQSATPYAGVSYADNVVTLDNVNLPDLELNVEGLDAIEVKVVGSCTLGYIYTEGASVSIVGDGTLTMGSKSDGAIDIRGNGKAVFLMASNTVTLKFSKLGDWEIVRIFDTSIASSDKAFLFGGTVSENAITKEASDAGYTYKMQGESFTQTPRAASSDNPASSGDGASASDGTTGDGSGSTGAPESAAAKAVINKATVTAKLVNKVAEQKTVTLGAKVKKIAASAFAKSNAKTLVVKTTKLKAATVKNALKGSKVTTVKVQVKTSNAKYVKTYKKIFTKKICGKKVTVK